jgi:hypothetical protein
MRNNSFDKKKINKTNSIGKIALIPYNLNILLSKIKNK